MQINMEEPGRLSSPTRINLSVCLSVSESVSQVTFNYSAENSPIVSQVFFKINSYQ